jgi:flagellar biosynthesis/type III secretory pathway ATPase
VKVDGVIAIIGEKGEKIDDLLKNSDAPKESTPEPAVVQEESEESSAASVDAAMLMLGNQYA